MNCPKCGSKSKVFDKRDRKKGLTRRRKCLTCETRWTTNEVIVLESIDIPANAKKEVAI